MKYPADATSLVELRDILNEWDAACRSFHLHNVDLRELPKFADHNPAASIAYVVSYNESEILTAMPLRAPGAMWEIRSV